MSQSHSAASEEVEEDAHAPQTSHTDNSIPTANDPHTGQPYRSRRLPQNNHRTDRPGLATHRTRSVPATRRSAPFQHSLASWSDRALSTHTALRGYECAIYETVWGQLHMLYHQQAYAQRRANSHHDGYGQDTITDERYRDWLDLQRRSIDFLLMAILHT